MINENPLSGEPDRVDSADTRAVPQEALEHLMPYQVSLLRALRAQRLAAQPAIAPYYQEPRQLWNGESPLPVVSVWEQLQSTNSLPDQQPLDLDAIFRAGYELRRQRETEYENEWSRRFVAGPTHAQIQAVNDLVFIRYEDMTPERQVAMHVMAEQIAQQSSRQLYERVMGNFASAIPTTEDELARRFDDSNTRLPLVPIDELQPQEPISDLRLQQLAAREERINSLEKHARALTHTLINSKKLEKQFPNPTERYGEAIRFVKSLGLE